MASNTVMEQAILDLAQVASGKSTMGKGDVLGRSNTALNSAVPWTLHGGAHLAVGMKKNLGKSDGSDLVVERESLNSVTLVGSCEALEEVESHLIDGRPMIWNTAENLPTVAELVAHTMTSDDSARDLEAFPSSIEDESLDDSDIEGVVTDTQQTDNVTVVTRGDGN